MGHLYEFPDGRASFNRRDIILYAVGVGSTRPEFIYELDPQFKVHPLYTLVLGLKGDSQDINNYKESFVQKMIPPISSGFPKIDLDKLVHGEQSTEIFGVIDTSCKSLLIKTRLLGVYETGQSLVMQKESKYFTNDGILVARHVMTAFVIGGGGFDGKRPPKSVILPIPNRDPDYSVDFQTSQNQAAIYRLSGDYNPLHIDPSIGKKIGMKGAILHGLCTLGISSNAIFDTICNGDSRRLKSIKTRFLSPVYPGDKLTTNIWLMDQTTAVFVTMVSKTKVLSGSCKIDVGFSKANL